MFNKYSRYFKLENSVKPDANGRVFESKTLRLLPQVSAQFRHIVEDVDRLDNLAYKYYKKPKQWWRLCDANPEFIAPLSMLGKDPIKETRFDLQWDGLQVLWHTLRETLTNVVGVETVLFGTEDQPYPDEVIFDTALLFSIAPALQTEFTACVMRQQLTAPLDAALQLAGLSLDSDIHIEQVSVAQWQLVEQSTKAIYIFRLESGVLNVYERQIRFSWSTTLRYNEKNISADELIVQMESVAGFTALAPTHIGRVGKPILVPSVSTGN